MRTRTWKKRDRGKQAYVRLCTDIESGIPQIVCFFLPHKIALD